MFGYKLGLIVPVVVFFVLFSVIGVGIYQINFDGNPWYFGSDTPTPGWDFLSK